MGKIYYNEIVKICNEHWNTSDIYCEGCPLLNTCSAPKDPTKSEKENTAIWASEMEKAVKKIMENSKVQK